MIERLIQPLLQERLKHYPAVALVGPRQCGKTTFAQSLASEYFDLEQENEGRVISCSLPWLLKHLSQQ